MLQKLTIENYALIDRLEIDFSEGFSVITGETGAGKSILLGALALILGQRVDTSVMINSSRKCIVEGTFRIGDYNLSGFFSENDLDYDEVAILRREIGQNAKSRAFINDTPVNLLLLKDLGDRLVNIHSQHSVITLNDENFQLAVLDNYAGTQKKVQAYRQLYRQLLVVKKELEELVQKEIRSRSDREYYRFLFDELQEASLNQDILEETEQRLALISHSGEIKNSLSLVDQLLSEGENALLDRLSEIISLVSSLRKYHPLLQSYEERLGSNLIDLKDIAGELERLAMDVVYDPVEMESLAGRLDQYYRLIKKHNVQDIAGLIAVRDDLDIKLQDVDSMEDRIKAKEKDMDAIVDELCKIAAVLSQSRKKVAVDIEEKVEETLKKLGMPAGRMKVEHTVSTELTRDGFDHVRFLFSANKGVELNEIGRIASGGELSRLMLSIKSLISQKNLLPTIIFDEIDTGVSGEIAGKVGSILRNMGRTMQVIVITHLPQIAGKGDAHYLVYKENDKKITRSNIRKLKEEERVLEIAKMLSNENVSESAYKTAEELMKK